MEIIKINDVKESLLKPINHHISRIVFQNLTYKPKCADRDILSKVNGEFQSGRMSAILGPSGAGKTTLLNVLSGFKYKGVKGTIFVNGEERRLKEFRRMSSYIQQEFALIEQLTVMETFQISAQLKLKSSIKDSERKSVIYDIIQLLNLEKCKDNLVSKISGGEKKRLCIGIELITNPPILFVDEPTSGLDSVSSYNVLMHLQKLAQNNRIVICTIHQPSSRLLELFDDVLVLSDGESIYNGPFNEMIKYFGEAGFQCPNYYNRADFALEVASKEHGEDLSRLILKSKNQIEPLEIMNKNEMNGEVLRENNFILKSFTKIKKIQNPSKQKYAVHFFKQFCVLLKRSLISMSRDLMCVQLRIICHILVAILLGVVFWKIGGELSQVFSNSSCIFFFVMFLFFGNSMPTVLSCPLETAVFLREHLNNWYSVEAYYFAKFIADLPLQFLCSTLFCSIAYYMTGQSDDIDRFLMFWCIGLLITFLAQSIGLFAGSAFNMNLAIFLVPSFCIPMLIFAGYFIRYSELSEVLQPMIKVSYFRYGFEGFIQAVYGYNRTDITCTKIFCQFSSANSFLKWNEIENDSYSIDVLALLIWIVCIQFLFYLSLKIKVRLAQ